MKERPIIFGTDSVRAILDGRKTQTRRAVNDSNSRGNYQASELLLDDDGHYPYVDGGPSPAGNPGEYLHARLNREVVEANRGPGWYDEGIVERLYPWVFVGDRLWVRETWGVFDAVLGGRAIAYRADDVGLPADEKWRSPIHMPRWASRLTLEVTGVRVERLQEIRRGDIRAEGVDCPTHDFPSGFCSSECADLRAAFADAWDELNARRGFGWNKNPWVWAISFEVVSRDA